MYAVEHVVGDVMMFVHQSVAQKKTISKLIPKMMLAMFVNQLFVRNLLVNMFDENSSVTSNESMDEHSY